MNDFDDENPFFETGPLDEPSEPTEFDMMIEDDLAQLGRATAYAEELVDDDYLWTDATAAYLRHHLEALMKLIGVERPSL